VTAAELLADLTCQGFSLTPEGTGIRIRPASRLSAGLRQAIVANRSGLLDLLAWRQAPATAELAELVDWFTANAGRLPQEPFGLVPGRRSGWAVWVKDPARFYAALRTDLAAGPSAARARAGALTADLRRLRVLFGG
jgi:hypothetical protein